jgi:hypothetical protein
MNLIKLQDAQQPGEYKRTLIDERKSNADFLVLDMWGNHVTVKFKKDPNLSGRGIRKGNNVYYVTRKVFDSLKKQYPNYANNF